MPRALRQAREEVTLFHQRYEVKAKLQRGGLDTNPGVYYTTGDTQRHGDVSMFDVLRIAPQLTRQDGMLAHEMVHQQASPGAWLPIHEAQSV